MTTTGMPYGTTTRVPARTTRPGATTTRDPAGTQARVPTRTAAAPAGAGPGGRQAAGARPPGRRDQRRPGTPRPQRRPYLAPHELFAERLLAVLSGRRPVHWMLGQTVGDAYEQLVRLAPATPLRARGTLPVIRACRASQPRTGVVEASASIGAGEQVRAMAFRLEQGPDLRWRCAAVELGGRHAPGPHGS